MKKLIGLSILAVAMAFILPILLSVSPLPRPEAEPEISALREPVQDAGITLTVQTGDGLVNMTLAEYLPLAIAGEMPAAFGEEALKAQAVALRSYALHYRSHHKENHPDADICTYAGCCAAFAEPEQLRETWGANYATYMAKMEAAAVATDGQYLVYAGEPILAVFHSASSGVTENGNAVGTDYPYLVSVDTPETGETVTNLHTTVEVDPADFRTTVETSCPEAQFGDDPSTWVGAVSLNAAGRVSQVQIGGTLISGLALRQMFALRSTDFTLAYTGDRFLFRVSGYGHGLGMSQYGANLLDAAGENYVDILAHYYPGAELVMAIPDTPEVGNTVNDVDDT